MIDKNHVDADTSVHLSQIIHDVSEPTARVTAQEVIDYYMTHFDVVQIVRCDACKSDLCLEVLDPRSVGKYKQTHPQGMRRIQLEGSPLLSSRARLDGMMGYECKCGNNTLNAEVELGIIPSIKNASASTMIPVIEPHHQAMVDAEIVRRKYQPDIEITGNRTRIESFVVERIK